MRKLSSGAKVLVPIPVLDVKALRDKVEAFNTNILSRASYRLQPLKIMENLEGPNWAEWFRQFPFIKSQDPEHLESDMAYAQIADILSTHVSELLRYIEEIHTGVFDLKTHKARARRLLADGKKTGLAWYTGKSNQLRKPHYLVTEHNGAIYYALHATSEEDFLNQISNIKINHEAINASKENTK
jgi:hypothetical protein